MNDDTRPLRFWRNGALVQLNNLHASTTLLELLRDSNSPAAASCLGTKEGCGEGDCGACTVVIGEPEQRADGPNLKLRAINSCIRLAHSIDGCAVWTVTDIGRMEPHPVQQAMVESHASQCGFCTPGFVMSLFALYHTQPAGADISREHTQNVLSGNLCRCTGYRPILDAAGLMMSLPAVTLDGVSIASQLLALPARTDHSQVGGAWRPATVRALLELRNSRPQAQVIAGCTDVGLWITKQHKVYDEVIDVTSVAELHKIQHVATGFRFGAAARLPEVFAALCADRPELTAFTNRFAGLPIRNSATLGGNIANGSPIGDSMPLLIALGASVVLGSMRGERSLPLEDFYLGYRKTALASDELVLWVDVPAPAPTQFVRAYKLSKRFDDDISAVCLAISLEFESNGQAQNFQGKIASARIGVGGMAATPVRAIAVESALIGQVWSLQLAKQAGSLLSNSFQPISDMRATHGYRSLAVAQLMQRAWLESRGFSVNLESMDAVAKLPSPQESLKVAAALGFTP